MNKYKINNINKIRAFGHDLQPILEDLSLALVG